jgi:homoserine O-acetyltransferase
MMRGVGTMLVEKKRFAVPQFRFETGVTLPVEIGYETYGTLNEDRSNAILICHYFSGTSHSGGTGYLEDPDERTAATLRPGWWESLIGPGKAFDTDRFFLISSDVICNLHPNNPYVVTTGPATIDPQTGEPYGMSFPQVTIRDFVHIQRQLLDSLGVETLYCVGGPSMGGMQALQWAVEYPESVRNVIAVITTGQTSAYTSVMPLQIGIEAIGQSPQSGLLTASKALTIQSDNLLADTIWRESASNSVQFQAAVDEAIRKNIVHADPLHWLYLARACQSFSLQNGFDSIEEALSRIQADVLLIPCDTDRLFPPEDSRYLLEQLRKVDKNAKYFELKSQRGHYAGVIEGEKIAEPIREYLLR